MDEELLSLKQVAEMAGVSYVTAQRWAKRGKLAYIKLAPKSWRVKKSDFEAFLEKRRQPATDPDLVKEVLDTL